MKLLIHIILVLTVQSLHAQLIYETVWVNYDSAMEYKSLQLVPVRTKEAAGQPGPRIISLNKAIEQGIASISERGSASTENVHWLRVNNRSDNIIYVGSGQTFTGGRQDRMATRDTLLEPTGSDQYFPVMCIEEGRWSEKEKKFFTGNYANLRLRQVLDKSKNQVLIWKEIFSQLDSADFRSATLAYSSIQQNKKLKPVEDDYFRYFIEKFRRSDSSITGFVCISGNRVIGCDIFKDKAMFYDELEPLLYGYINEAVTNGGPPMLEKDQVKEYMDRLLTNETMQAEFCREKGKIFRVNNKVIHVTSY